ncbi:hypothetical protein ACHAWC_002219 [Mediolabrus comicus]
MCSESQALRKRTQQKSAPDVSTKDVKRLQPFAKNPVGLFTSKVTSPTIIRQKHNNIDARKYLVAQAGLENFIRSIVAALNLTLPNTVRFNMNGQGRMETWEDVYMAERVYTQCLGISKRIYQTHAYIHEPDKKLAYFILEEHNERTSALLPGFDFHVLVFCYYNEKREVTAVDVQYDQLSFFLHCMGLAQMHAWFVERVVTPVAITWSRAFAATGLVNPFTFMLQLILFPVLLLYLWRAT